VDDLECPINDFQFRRRADPVLEQKKYTKKKIDEDVYFYFTNQNLQGQFIVDTQLVDQEVCIYSQELHTSITQYPLMKGNFKSHCSTIPHTSQSRDSRYKEAVPYKKRDLYDENGISYYLFRLAGFYNSYLGGDASLFTRGYIHWSDDCKFSEKDSKKETLIEIHSKMRSVRNYFWLILFFFLVLCGLNIALLVFLLKSHLLRYQHVIIGKGVLLINYVAYTIILKSQSIQNQLKDFMGKFALDICSDEVTNTILRESFRLFNKVESLQKAVFYMWKYFLYMVIVFSFLVFLPLIYKMMLIKIKLVAI
jgi:hypothetical protein